MFDYAFVRGDDRDIGIKCRKCGLTSWNENDVRALYCGNCHKFHEANPMAFFDWGVFTIIIVPIVVTLVYQGWKWPYEAQKDLRKDN